MLDAFIVANRTEIINRCQAKVAGRREPVGVGSEVNHGVPMFLDQLLDDLRNGPSADSDIGKTASQHGSDLFAQGYTVSQVVHDYGDVCQAVTDLAVENGGGINAEDFRTLNRCLDDAIAGAVTEYGNERDRLGAREHSPADVHRAAIVRDLIRTIEIARVTFEAIKSGRVGVGGSTGTVLGIGLQTAGDLAERLLEIDALPVA